MPSHCVSLATCQSFYQCGRQRRPSYPHSASWSELFQLSRTKWSHCYEAPKPNTAQTSPAHHLWSHQVVAPDIVFVQPVSVTHCRHIKVHDQGEKWSHWWDFSAWEILSQFNEHFILCGQALLDLRWSRRQRLLRIPVTRSPTTCSIHSKTSPNASRMLRYNCWCSKMSLDG